MALKICSLKILINISHSLWKCQLRYMSLILEKILRIYLLNPLYFFKLFKAYHNFCYEMSKYLLRISYHCYNIFMLSIQQGLNLRFRVVVFAYRRTFKDLLTNVR
jgi:hypothetical protein